MDPLEILEPYFDHDEQRDRYSADLNDIITVLNGFPADELLALADGMVRSGSFRSQMLSTQADELRKAIAIAISLYAYEFFTGEPEPDLW